MLVKFVVIDNLGCYSKFIVIEFLSNVRFYRLLQDFIDFLLFLENKYYCCGIKFNKGFFNYLVKQ